MAMNGNKNSLIAELYNGKITFGEYNVSLRDVRSILDAHYLHRDPALADAAITKLERRTESPN